MTPTAAKFFKLLSSSFLLGLINPKTWGIWFSPIWWSITITFIVPSMSLLKTSKEDVPQSNDIIKFAINIKKIPLM